jgi:hypothetical protein
MAKKTSESAPAAPGFYYAHPSNQIGPAKGVHGDAGIVCQPASERKVAGPEFVGKLFPPFRLFAVKISWPP